MILWKHLKIVIHKTMREQIINNTFIKNRPGKGSTQNYLLHTNCIVHVTVPCMFCSGSFPQETVLDMFPYKRDKTISLNVSSKILIFLQKQMSFLPSRQVSYFYILQWTTFFTRLKSTEAALSRLSFSTDKIIPIALAVALLIFPSFINALL